MLVFIIAAVCIASSVGIGIIISKKRFDNNISDAKNTNSSPVAPNNTLNKEIGRYEQLKTNLVTVKNNVDRLNIPIPEPLTNWDDAESSLNKLSQFFEKYSKSTAGTEAFILSILPVSQTGEALCSFAEVLPGSLSSAFTDSVNALKDAATIPGIDDISTCLSKFCEGVIHMNHHGLATALQHHNYMGALLAPVKSGIVEMSGMHDAANSLTESMHNMGCELGNAVELSLDPTDLTDLDFSGHIPVITIAISSFREFNLLMDNKTNALTSLKHISLDAVGAGGGGLVGAKAGAIAGSFFGPVGTLIGGIVGGIGGAMGGRALTNNIKQQPLKNAIADYQNNASIMKSETRDKSREMLQSINTFANEKNNAFKGDKLLKEIPVVESENTVLGITMIIYYAVVEHVKSMKDKVRKLEKSFWYSDSKYSVIVNGYKQRIADLEKQLPPIKNIENNPKLALEALLAVQIPNQKSNPIYKKKFLECSKELKEMNDKNNSSILVWSYMINGLYQRTMNEIADYTNSQMTAFNQFIAKWKQKMSSLENKVDIEKAKLGLN